MNEKLLHGLSTMAEAAAQALVYVEGLDEAEFLADRRTQDAVMMQTIVIGEAVAKLIKSDNAFLRRHPDVPWVAMAAMRHLSAHHYAKVNFRTVCVTLQDSIPDLLRRLPAIIEAAKSYEP